MAQLALNKFQTVTFQVTTAEQTVYTAPTGYTAIVLYAHIANFGTSSSTVTMKHKRSGTETEIIKGANVPIAEAFVPMSGKLMSLIHISEPTRPLYICYDVFCL